jgi:hypothetical protein
LKISVTPAAYKSEAIERAGHDRLRLISEPDEGIYGGLNEGVRNAAGDIIGISRCRARACTSGSTVGVFGRLDETR